MLTGRELSFPGEGNSTPKGPEIPKQEEAVQELRGSGGGVGGGGWILKRQRGDQPGLLWATLMTVSVLRVTKAGEHQVCTSEWGRHLLS